MEDGRHVYQAKLSILEALVWPNFVHEQGTSENNKKAWLYVLPSIKMDTVAKSLDHKNAYIVTSN